MVRSAFDQIFENVNYKLYHDTYTIAAAGNLVLDDGRFLEMNNDFLLNYNNMNMFGGDTWSLNFSIGGNLLHQKWETHETRTDRLLKPNLFVINNTSTIRASQDFSERKLHSLYGFATIGFNNYLFLDLTGRNDWSSTLPKDNWSFFYPSVGLSWVVTDMLNTASDFLTFAKVRGSYAEVGNDTDPYRLASVINFSAGGNFGYGDIGGSLPAEDLLPEKNQSMGIWI